MIMYVCYILFYLFMYPIIIISLSIKQKIEQFLSWFYVFMYADNGGRPQGGSVKTLPQVVP